MLHSMLGLPSECVHENVIRSCTLSFSCWIQGGRHAEGCGNKWLLSCCILDMEAKPPNIISEIPSQMMPSSIVKQNMLRRRMDDNGMVIDCFLIVNQLEFL